MDYVAFRIYFLGEDCLYLAIYASYIYFPFYEASFVPEILPVPINLFWFGFMEEVSPMVEIG